jgi:hypothetical protein
VKVPGTSGRIISRARIGGAGCAALSLEKPVAPIPAPNTQNDDHNPARVARRILFDLTVGNDNLFKGDRYKWSLQGTVINRTFTVLPGFHL